MMSSGQADQLIKVLEKMERNQVRLARELVAVSQEMFLARKVFEALLSPEQRETVERYLRTPTTLVPSQDDLPFPGEEALQTSQALIQGQAQVGQSGVLTPTPQGNNLAREYLQRPGHGG